MVAADDLSTHNSGAEVSITGHNSILPKEVHNKFYCLNILQHLEKDVCAVASWDSSIHDSLHLNRVTDRKCPCLHCYAWKLLHCNFSKLSSISHITHNCKAITSSPNGFGTKKTSCIKYL